MYKQCHKKKKIKKKMSFHLSRRITYLCLSELILLVSDKRTGNIFNILNAADGRAASRRNRGNAINQQQRSFCPNSCHPITLSPSKLLKLKKKNNNYYKKY